MNKIKEKPIIIGIGEFLWDMLPTGKKAGGAPVNFVYHALRMGAESYAISAVGNDLLGDEIMKELDEIGIEYVIERVDIPTGTVVVSLKDGIPDYEIIENVAWDYIPMTNQIEDLARKADAICFGTLAQRSKKSRKTIQSVLSIAPKETYKVFDINIRQNFYTKEIITASLNACNVLKMNDEELVLLKELFDNSENDENIVCNWFIKEFNLRFLILTAGSNYSKIFTPKTCSHIKTPTVEVVDTVGAGDSFTGAFITSVLNGRSLSESHQEAVRRAAFVCTRNGAWV